jgi:hypothetical protein
VRETLEESGVLVQVTGIAGVFSDAGHVVVSTGRRRSDLRRAVRAVYSAVAALRHAPRSPDVARSISKASAAVAILPTSFTTEALYRLLGAVEDCHRAGTATSTRLAERWRVVSFAVRLNG